MCVCVCAHTRSGACTNQFTDYCDSGDETKTVDFFRFDLISGIWRPAAAASQALVGIWSKRPPCAGLTSSRSSDVAGDAGKPRAEFKASAELTGRCQLWWWGLSPSPSPNHYFPGPHMGTVPVEPILHPHHQPRPRCSLLPVLFIQALEGGRISPREAANITSPELSRCWFIKKTNRRFKKRKKPQIWEQNNIIKKSSRHSELRLFQRERVEMSWQPHKQRLARLNRQRLGANYLLVFSSPDINSAGNYTFLHEWKVNSVP